jgi:site-specific DNA recombinase
LTDRIECAMLRRMNLTAIPEPRKRRKQGKTAPSAASKAAIYLRVSTDEQADNGNSLDSQEQACRKFCEARGLEVARMYVDPGASGGKIERKALTELRESVAAGDVAVVVVYAVDRLSRRQADMLTLLEEFERHGAGFAAASQPFDTTSPAGRAMLGVLTVFAELQREEIRERTRVALKGKQARGEPVGRAPFGLRRATKRREGEAGRYERDPATWPIVERILSERAAGSSCQEIADRLNADAIPTATATRKEKRGIIAGAGKWHAATVASICRNRYVLEVAKRD